MTESRVSTPEQRRKKLACAYCGGTGVSRNSKQFFYGVSLMASGVLVFYEWPPIPSLVGMIEALARSVGLPGLAGSSLVWVLAAVPAVFGCAFIYLWLSHDTCPACNGSCRSPVALWTGEGDAEEDAPSPSGGLLADDHVEVADHGSVHADADETVHAG